MTLLWDAKAAVKDLLKAALEQPVYDAGELVGDDDLVYVTIGEAGENGETATAEQTESTLSGTYWRNETGQIPCVIDAWSGDTDLGPLRDAAKPLLAQCLAVIRSDQTLGGLLAPPGQADVTAISLREGQTDRGALVQAAFTVRYTALIT